MTRDQFIDEFHRLSKTDKAVLLKELVEKETDLELREDLCDYLLALQAEEEGGFIPFEEYKKSRANK